MQLPNLSKVQTFVYRTTSQTNTIGYSSSFGRTRSLGRFHPEAVTYSPPNQSLLRPSLPLKRFLNSKLFEEASLVRSFSQESSTNDLWTKKENRTTTLCGIRNIGNSCYQNSVTQFLYGIPEFRTAILELVIFKTI